MSLRVFTFTACLLCFTGLSAQSRVEHRIRWGAVPGAIGYQVQVRGPGGKIVLDARTETTAFEFSVGEGQHFVRLGARNKFGETDSWSGWAPLDGGRTVEDPRAVAERKRKEEEAQAKRERAVADSKREKSAAEVKQEQATAEAKRERAKEVVAIRAEIRKRTEEATGEFTLSGGAVLRGIIVKSTEDTVVIRGEHGILEVARADIEEARIYAGGTEKIVPAKDLKGVKEVVPKEKKPKLTSGTVPEGRVQVIGDRIVLETRVGRIPLRPEDVEDGPKAPAHPPGPELKTNEYGIIRLKGGAEVLGTVLLRTEHAIVVQTTHGQIEVSADEVLYTRAVAPAGPGLFARLRKWLGL